MRPAPAPASADVQAFTHTGRGYKLSRFKFSPDSGSAARPWGPGPGGPFESRRRHGVAPGRAASGPAESAIHLRRLSRWLTGSPTPSRDNLWTVTGLRLGLVARPAPELLRSLATFVPAAERRRRRPPALTRNRRTNLNGRAGPPGPVTVAACESESRVPGRVRLGVSLADSPAVTVAAQGLPVNFKLNSSGLRACQ